jgi:hypothetical protein
MVGVGHGLEHMEFILLSCFLAEFFCISVYVSSMSYTGIHCMFVYKSLEMGI